PVDDQRTRYVIRHRGIGRHAEDQLRVDAAERDAGRRPIAGVVPTAALRAGPSRAGHAGRSDGEIEVAGVVIGRELQAAAEIEASGCGETAEPAAEGDDVE